jgi:hypothetical protein
LPYQHFFVRMREQDRGTSFFGNDEVEAPDPYAVVRAALRGKFGYIHEPLVYTRYHAQNQTSKKINDRDAGLLIAHLRLVKVFGPKCWDERELNQVLDSNVGRLARFVLRWRLSGHVAPAKAMSAQLAKEGFRLGWLSYSRYALSWPSYALKKLSSRTTVGPAMDEKAFLEG